MKAQKFYELPDLGYDYDALAPYMSEEQLKLHHSKHHAAYVNGANAILTRMDKARISDANFDTKSTFKELAFNVGGHVLHSLLWRNLAPPSDGGGGKPTGSLANLLDAEYGSFDRFKRLFSQTAVSTEGSGWTALAFCTGTMRPLIAQIEKHNINVYPMFSILLTLDVWEHAYYLDYKNDRTKFVDACWNIVNWSEVSQRLSDLTTTSAAAAAVFQAWATGGGHIG